MKTFENSPMRAYAKWEARMWRRAELRPKITRLATLLAVCWLALTLAYFAV